jgi:hypothetical protein
MTLPSNVVKWRLHICSSEINGSTLGYLDLNDHALTRISFLNMVLRTFIFLFILTATAMAQSDGLPGSVIDLYDRDSLQLIRKPDQVFVVLLKHQEGSPIERTIRKALPLEAQQKVSKLLVRNSSFAWKTWKLCIPFYGARLIFQSKAQTVSIDFCFMCDILSIESPSRQSIQTNFDPCRDELLTLIKAQFPKDKEIQGVELRGSSN